MAELRGCRIGFIGLGLMGRPMSLNLLGAGADLVIHNRSQGVVQELAARGMRPAGTPAAVAAAADMIILMLPDTPAVEQVLQGPNGVAMGLRPGGLIIDMGTTAVADTRRFAAIVAEQGGDFLDAPVSGGQIGAETASLTIMAGGSDAAFAGALPLLQALGKTITHMGGVGTGQVAKAANQVIVGLTIGAVAEAMALARRGGVEPERLRQALMGGFAGSRILDVHGRRMAERNFAPGARATTQRKDLAQALALAEDLGLDLPATRLCRELYDRLTVQGDGGLDHSALVKVYGWD